MNSLRQIEEEGRAQQGRLDAPEDLAGGGAVEAVYVPIFIGQAIDHILAVGRVDFSELLLTLRWLAVTVVGAALTQWISMYCTNRLAYETSRDLRDEAYAKFNVLSLSFIDSHSHGDLLSRVINDVDAVGQGLLSTCIMGSLIPPVITILTLPNIRLLSPSTFTLTI